MKKFFIFFILILFTNSLYSQNDKLKIKGYSQSIFQDVNVDFLDERVSEYNGFMLQQSNFFLERQITPQMKTFFNIEFTNNQDHQNNFGNITLEEAWVSYHINENHHLKFGKLIPEYGAFNTLRNRIPISPFITRPAIYENLFNGGFNIEEYVPKHSFFEYRLTNKINSGNKIEWFFSIGNSSDNVLIGDEDVSISNGLYSGQDTTLNLSYNFKINYNFLKPEMGIFDFGISASRDVNVIENHSAFIEQPPLGNVVRYRVVGHIKIRGIKTELISEYYRNFYDISNNQRDILMDMENQQRSLGLPLSQTSRNESHFFYTMITRRLTDHIRVHSRYENFTSVFSGATDRPLNIFVIGGEYRIHNIALKTEYISAYGRNENYVLNSNIKNVYFVRAFRIATSINF